MYHRKSQSATVYHQPVLGCMYDFLFILPFPLVEHDVLAFYEWLALLNSNMFDRKYVKGEEFSLKALFFYRKMKWLFFPWALIVCGTIRKLLTVNIDLLIAVYYIS